MNEGAQKESALYWKQQPTRGMTFFQLKPRVDFCRYKHHSSDYVESAAVTWHYHHFVDC